MVDGLISEWASILPSLDILMQKFSDRRAIGKLNTVIDADFLLDLCVQLSARESHLIDNVNQATISFFENDSSENYDRAVKIIASELYRVGVIGLNLQANEPYRFSFKDEPRLNPSSISVGLNFQIHSAFHVALNIRPQNNPRITDILASGR
jgi:hypothetical protein